MIKLLLFLILLSSTIPIFGQDSLIKDIDYDGVNDTIYIDRGKSTIICILSTNNFSLIESKPIEILNNSSGILSSKNGFIFYNEWMRAGYKNQFRYNKKTKNIQLIGMSRYEFGNAANDGSGDSSINLLTHEYIGNWNCYIYNTDGCGDLVKIPTINSKMDFGVIYLKDFSDDIYFDYGTRCANLYNESKQHLMQKKQTNKIKRK